MLLMVSAPGMCPKECKPGAIAGCARRLFAVIATAVLLIFVDPTASQFDDDLLSFTLDVPTNCTTPELAQVCTCTESLDGSRKSAECVSTDQSLSLAAVPHLAPALHMIFITQSNIKTIRVGDFSPVSSTLEVLDLSNNAGLYGIPASAFTGLSSLYRLSLAQCNISYLETGLLDPLTNLTFLDLNTNRLRSIMPCQFQRLAKLQTVDLSYNKLTDLAPGTFANLHQLSNLKLDHNKLQTLLPETFFLLPNTTLKHLEINLGGNPFSCNCRSLWLNWLVVDSPNRDPILHTPFCELPQSLNQQPFDNVDASELCSLTTPEVLIDKKTITLGQTTSLTCASFTSVRRPWILWYKDGVYQVSRTRSHKRYHTYYGVLTIENVTHEDAGVWHCRVSDPGLGSAVESDDVTLSVSNEAFCHHPVPGADGGRSGTTTPEWVGIGIAIVVVTIIAIIVSYCFFKRCSEVKSVRREVHDRSHLPTNMVVQPVDNFGLAENPEYLRYLKHTSQSSINSGGVGVLSYQRTGDKLSASHPPQNPLSLKASRPSGSSYSRPGDFGMDRGAFGEPRVIENPLVAMGYTQSDFDTNDERESLATTTLNRSVAATEAESEWSGIADTSMLTDLPGPSSRDGTADRKVSLDIFSELVAGED